MSTLLTGFSTVAHVSQSKRYEEHARACVHAKSLDHVCLCETPRSIAHQAAMTMGFPGKNTRVGCHAPLQGIFPAQGMKLSFLTSPALAGEFLTTRATWEAPK